MTDRRDPGDAITWETKWVIENGTRSMFVKEWWRRQQAIESGKYSETDIQCRRRLAAEYERRWGADIETDARSGDLEG